MRAVIVFAHGSRDPLWRQPVQAVAQAIAARDPSCTVRCAYLELCEPTLAQAVDELVAHGATDIRVLPLFFGMGKHAREDLPALMRDLDHAMTLVEATVAAVSVPVTLKMRLGWDDASRNAPQLARRAEAAGVQLVTVHGRTRCQFYTGRADWRAIAEVREAVSIPLIANGDVATRSDCDEILRQSGADAVMVGRAAQGQPWLPGTLAGRDSAPKSVGELKDLITDHYQAMLSHYGIDTGVRHARKHLSWYVSRFAAGAPIEMKARIMTGTEPSDVLAAIGEAFSNFAALSLPATTIRAAA